MWKEIRYGRMSEKEKSMLVSEVNILRELKHPNIVRYKVSPYTLAVAGFQQSRPVLVVSPCSLSPLVGSLSHHRKQDRIIDRESSTIYIIMEFCENGDLSSVIRKYVAH